MSSMFGPNKYARATLPDTGWVDLALQNGWVDFDTNAFGTASYRNYGGMVYVRGVIKSGTTTANILIATLPVGCRPSKTTIMPLVNTGTSGSYGRFDVWADGRILGNSGLSATYTVLTFPPFIAEQ